MEEQIPIIYFLGSSPGKYQPIIPTFVVGWDPGRLRAQLALGALVGASAAAIPPAAPERRSQHVGDHHFGAFAHEHARPTERGQARSRPLHKRGGAYPPITSLSFFASSSR
jgi:hypothetical protein